MLLDTAAPLSFPEKRAPTAIVCRGQSCALHAGRHGSRRPSQAWQVFGGRQGRHAYSIPDGAAKASDFCRSRHIVSSLRARDDAVVAMLACTEHITEPGAGRGSCCDDDLTQTFQSIENTRQRKRRCGMNDTVPALIAYCRKNGRVCPLPLKWHALWEALPERRRVGTGWEPPLPIILDAWHYASNLEKMIRLAEHIQWASRHNQLVQVSTFLRGLTEAEWHHLDD